MGTSGIHKKAVFIQMNVNVLIDLLKPTGYVMHQQVEDSRIVLFAHTVFMCFVRGLQL